MIYRVKLWPNQRFDRHVKVDANSAREAAEKLYGHPLDAVGSNAQLCASVLTEGPRSRPEYFYDRNL
jgi:hypothetical protein